MTDLNDTARLLASLQQVLQRRAVHTGDEHAHWALADTDPQSVRVFQYIRRPTYMRLEEESAYCLVLRVVVRRTDAEEKSTEGLIPLIPTLEDIPSK